MATTPEEADRSKQQPSRDGATSKTSRSKKARSTEMNPSTRTPVPSSPNSSIRSAHEVESSDFHLRCRPRTSRCESFDSSVQRSEEHTSELQSLMRISYAVFCLQKNTLIL